jgi:hypothetical protein
MTQDELQEWARRQPFRPFRLTLTTGAAYEIRHPDLIMVGRRSAVLGVTRRPDRRVFDTALQVDLLHVVSVEEIVSTAPGPNGPED